MAELTITMTGNGQLGDVEAGWSVTEDATPVAPGDSFGGTGNVSLSARALTHAEFVINNGIEISHNLGSIHGLIASATIRGMPDTTTNASLGVDTLLNLLNVDKSTQPLGEGVYIVGWGSRE